MRGKTLKNFILKTENFMNLISPITNPDDNK